ncbi:MAG: YcxB family protein [Armatimonadota bacterium]|nr:YcxB family protein [Armatimonadota bacterium]
MFVEVTYTLTHSDLFDFHKHVAFRQPRFWIGTIIRVLFFPTLYLGVSLFLGMKLLTVIALTLLMTGAMTFFVWWTYRSEIIKNAAAYPGAFQTQIVWIDADGVHAKSDLGAGVSSWAAYSELTETDKLICFMQNRVDGLAVPKRAFTHPADAQRFFETAVACWKSAQSDEPAPDLADNNAWPPPPRRTV